jgi:hypothetical protein
MIQKIVWVAFAAALTMPTKTVAQQPIAADSLAAMIRQMQQKLDSLEGVIRQLQSVGQDAAPVVDELAALRAAAQAAAQDAAPTGTEDGGSRTGNLQLLNPEISVTGDIVGNLVSPDGGSTSLTAVPREFEFSFQAALDPYTRAKVFIAKEEEFEVAGFDAADFGAPLPDPSAPAAAEEDEHGGFTIEEGYMYWVGLPGGIGLKVGKFRQNIGLYNRWHTHALKEVERPLATMAFLGEDGLIQTGAAVTLPSFTVGPATQTLVAEVTRGSNEVLFFGGTDLSYLSRFQSFWDLGGVGYMQFGTTGLVGQNDAVSTKLVAFDFALQMSPPGQSKYREFSLKGEWYLAEREESVGTGTGKGGYLQANYKASRSWTLGVRADHADGFGPQPTIVQFVPSVTWWQSEWVYVRMQYNNLRPRGMGANHTLLIQFVWAVGPDKHETY